jgi:peptidyl-tRNA hydrolase
MSELNLYFRQDLGMRKGKLAAQIAHAACAQLLNAMDDGGDVRLLPYAAYVTLQGLLHDLAVHVHPVENEVALRNALLDPANASIIIDRGLTEFGGVPTLTTAAQGAFSASPRKAVPMSGADLIARQWFVFSKERPLPKDHAARMAAIGCLKMMNQLMSRPTDAEDQAVLPLRDPALRGWLTAGFGKIGMGIKTDAALKGLREALEGQQIPTVSLEMNGTQLLVIGPQFPETVAPIMGRESDLYASGILSLL